MNNSTDMNNMLDRSLFYAAKTISNSIPSGETYRNLPKFITINILGYK